MRSVPKHFFKQSGVIAYRPQSPDLVLLITSSSGKRWVIPKGVVEPNLSPAASAVKEAEEEAGVLGTALETAVGTYSYPKWGGTCVVQVFPMVVTRVLDDWHESHRTREWVPVEVAAGRVREPELQRLLLGFRAPE